VIFHLAGQVAMTTSLSNPRLDFEINVLGGNNLLESVRKHQKYAIVTYSSTNKVYGDLEWLTYTEKEKRYLINDFPNGLDEKIPLDFQSPYGCSKGATDQYMLDYGKMFDLQTVVFRHSSIFGGRQFATVDQGWVGWFIKNAIEVKKKNIKNEITISGNGKQVRDILFAEDLKNCYFKAIENINSIKGQSFNIGGGFENSLSLLELFDILNNELDLVMNINKTNWRISDQKVFIANCDKAKREFNWEPKINKNIGIANMIEWVKSR
jgi:CDP-paratose 2-epimerase